jgi:Phage baseplate assembly protein W
MIDINKTVINFNYDTADIHDIKRCLIMLYSTREGEQPMDRDFGLNYQSLSQPLDAAKNTIALELIEKTERYEPRVKVQQVNFEYLEDGILAPIIHLQREEG